MTGRPRYQQDAYAREIDTVVERADGGAVSLRDTVFFPGGGGQPGDVGTLAWDGGTARIAEMRRDGATLWHVLDGPAPPAGAQVRAALDWDRRYAIMRHHTALHVLVGAVYKLFNARVTGGAIYPDRARMDFSLEDLSKDRVAAIEAEANRVIEAGHRVVVRYVTRDEFEQSDLSRLARNLVPDVPEIRVVEIEGYDAQADGGTHVAGTREIGRLRVTKTENKGKSNRRLEIALDAPAQ